MSEKSLRILRLYVLGVFLMAGAALAWLVWSSLERLAAPIWGSLTHLETPTATASVPRETKDLASFQVAQAFTAPLPGLCSVSVVLEAPVAGDMAPVTFRLAGGLPGANGASCEVEASHSIVTRTVEPAPLLGAISYRFDFPPLAESAGRGYTFTLHSSGAQPGHALAARYLPDAQLEGAHACFDGLPQPGVIEFATRYALTPWQKIGRLLERMAAGKPGLLGRPALYASLKLAFVLCLAAMFWLVARRILDEERNRA